MNQTHVDREFMQLTRQFNRRVDAGRPKRRPNPIEVIAVVVAAEVAITLALILF